ncbi:sensor histidine kinase [Albidovulum sediminicola]|uniref:histidine kinase n=1 Tax=Albidovulum sediminicola TaxID=2984331 RepID=A0ABT2Z6N0_9RHOB|nr:ATP-binding protein [Defluviimonas sp. WL0075]MCV2866662.1 ATP-binding protein [Defluviimonas sp. WL0075]
MTWFIGWAFACLLALAAIWVSERASRLSTLTAESARLHGVASQRVDQHDAHLTALSAIAVAGAESRPDLFREVAGAVIRFYPRVIGVLLVPLAEDRGVLEIGVAGDDVAGLIRDAARRSNGAPVLVQRPGDTGAYLIVKRSPNSDAPRYGLALVIDAAALLDGDSDYWGRPETARRLSLPDGTPLLADGAGLAVPQFARALSSNTQPLLLETVLTLTPADLLPPGSVAMALALITIIVFGLRAIMRQRAQMREAERRAELSGLESRLSHASRVNALGEMASGMAHELTQPLTAVLAQAQAARRLAMRGDTDKLAPVLEGVIDQTKRASAILERLRTWTRPQQRRPEPIDLRDCLQVAKTLLSDQARAADADLRLNVPALRVPVVVDRVEVEQVLFNLIRNGLDAVREVDGARLVSVTLTVDNGIAEVEVADTGPGIRADVRDRIFTPFVTTRENGTGLGLTLSQRLIERAGGDLVLMETKGGARFRVSLPLGQPRQAVAE